MVNIAAYMHSYKVSLLVLELGGTKIFKTVWYFIKYHSINVTSAKTVPFGTFGTSRNTILKH